MRRPQVADDGGAPLVQLDPDACWRMLMSGVTVGRVALESGNGLVVIPVNFVVDGNDVVFRTAEDGLLGRAADWGRSVAFEVDEFDEGLHEGWSVVAQGQLRRASEEDSVRLSEAVKPWASGDRRVVGRIVVDRITGRQIGD
jgi:nitroimidazol reductase NimA-like FMN-containing flavoprotein (pyridoxamine 5'-phosphate oxidase superfamily)